VSEQVVVGMSVGGLLPPPPADLDPVLDAAARCFARYGIKRTTVPDIAADLGVSRATVYRRVGNVEDIARLLLARDLHAYLGSLLPELNGVRTPAELCKLLARLVRAIRQHPVAKKVLTDEPDLVGPFLIAELPAVVDRVASFAVPFLEARISEGVFARRDPAILAGWVVRMMVSLIIAPVRDLEPFLEDVLVPVLATS
jgi:AcrR family transcriptional regulator